MDMTVPGESYTSRFLNFSSIGLVALLLLYIVIGGNTTSKLISIAIIVCIILYIRSKMIATVALKENLIVVKYFLNSKLKSIEYSDVTKLYYNKEPFVSTHIYVIKFKKNGKERKITFYCKKKDFESNIGPLFLTKGIELTERWNKFR